ncbi:MAG: UDP-N-acetylmuramate dehydrogenase [Bacilli bacterium]|nr:UDP-N-acetylmuramate dehydrogenase [Bacilli bacterium]
MVNIINEIKKNKIGDIFENVLLSKYNTYRIGGKSKLIVYPKNTDKLIILLTLLKEHNIKYKVIGCGSNLIFSDKDYDGVIIKLDRFNHLNLNDTVIKVGSGYSLIKLATETVKLGLRGLEFATGIPGTIGGAVFMNAGAYKSDMGYIVSSVKVLTPDLKIKDIYNRDMNFKYRTSFLQKNKGYICLEVTLALKHGDRKLLEEVTEDRRQKRLLTQPLEFPSAGSVFRNPENDYAGRLIEESGLKGYRIGGAMVSEKHANFIVNVDHAKAEDIKSLIDLVKTEVKKKFKIDLLVEQEFVNWE